MRRVVSCFLLFFLIGCSDTTPDNEASFGAEDWAIQESQLQLEEDLYITEMEDYFFGAIADVAADEEGRIYVADARELHVKVLSPEGELLHTVGRQGEAPGEFGALGQLHLAYDDSLYVFSAQPKRVSVFAPENDYRHVRSIPIPDEEGDAGDPRMLEGHGLVARVVEWPSAVDNPDERTMVIRNVNDDGTLGDTLFEMPAAEIVMWRTARGQAGGPLPFGRTPHFEVGPGGLIHAAWSDSLSVTRYKASGDRDTTITLPFEHIPVASTDVDHVREEISSSHFDAAENQIPDMKPAFDQFLVDDEGRYWFQRPTDDPDRSDWWIADPAESTISVVSNQSAVTFTTVRNGFAYGYTKGDRGEPTLIRYRIEE